MTQYPLLFSLEEKVPGNKFLASVTAHGRVLASQEGDEWWMYSVQPGDIAASGKTFVEAYWAFRNEFKTILFDIAVEAENFPAFKAETEAFFSGINQPTAKDWSAAVAMVRAGQITARKLSNGLRTLPADSPRSVRVRMLLSARRPTT